MRLNSAILTIASILTVSGTAALASAEDLKGNVAEVFVLNTGELAVDLSGDTLGNLYLCSVSSTTRTTTPSACEQMQSLLMAAKLAGLPVVISGTKVQRSSGTSTAYNVTVDYVKADD